MYPTTDIFILVKVQWVLIIILCCVHSFSLVPAADSETSKCTLYQAKLQTFNPHKKLMPDTFIEILAQETVTSVTEMVRSGFLVTGCGPIQQDAAAYVLLGLVLASLYQYC